MARHRHMDVIVVECMRRRAIDERRRQRWQLHVMANDARLLRPAGLRHLVEQDPDERILRPGEGHAEIVENALAREFAHRRGQTIIAEGTCFSGENPGQIGLGTILCHSVHFYPPI